jgi:hypothetical protein
LRRDIDVISQLAIVSSLRVSSDLSSLFSEDMERIVLFGRAPPGVLRGSSSS